MKTFKVSVLLLLFSALSFSVFAQPSEENKASALKAIENINQKNWDGFKEFLADDFVEYAAPQPVKGRDAAIASMEEYMSAFPDMHVQPEKAVSDGNTVMIVSTITGTWKNDFMGMKATGKSFSFRDVDIIEFNDEGKAVAHWAIQDPMVMMSQISN